MSGAVSVDVYGYNELMATFSNEPAILEVPVRDFMLDADAIAQQSAYEHAAKDTGLMSDSLYSVFDTAVPMSFFQLIAPVDYSDYQESGTDKMPAHPFMGPALDDASEAMDGHLLVKLGNDIARAMGAT